MKLPEIIGLTGGIGAGKSVVARVLRCKGFTVYDCDLEARRLMDASCRVREEIRKTLGEQCVADDGSLCRPAIAAKVFADDSLRLWLNALVHGMVKEDIIAKAREVSGYMFVESAILRSSSLDRICRQVWVVDAPESERVGRVCGRDSTDSEKVMARIRAQRDELNRLQCAEIRTIDNSGHLPLLPQIDNLLKQL